MIAVYAIINVVDGKAYIGGTTQYKKRINNHLINLRLNRHENRNLQSAFNQHGEEHFFFIILEECKKKILKEREQHWLDTIHNKYNIVPNARGGRLPGIPLSEEWKKRIGEGAKGNKGNVNAPRTLEWRRNLSEAGKRRWARVRGEIQ